MEEEIVDYYGPLVYNILWAVNTERELLLWFLDFSGQDMS